MTKMSGSQALVKSLYKEGIRVVFGLPGIHIYPILDSIYDEQNIQFITTRHEQAASYMAFGYSKTGKGIGTALVVPGPGLLNASAGIGTAYAASSPILVISGQNNKNTIGLNRGELHEVNDQLDTVKPITKWASRITTASQIPARVQEAFINLRSGHPRPVEIEIPQDTLEEVDEINLLESKICEPITPSMNSLLQGAETLHDSIQPIIFAGGGLISSGGTKELQKLAEYLQSPVITTHDGKGSISEDHYLSIGTYSFKSDVLDHKLQQCDVILAVGTRLLEPKLSPKQKVVQIDIDLDEIGRNHQNTISIVGDARISLEKLYYHIASSTPPRSKQKQEISKLRNCNLSSLSHLKIQSEFIQAIRSAIPRDGILVEGATQIGYACGTFFPVYNPNTYITSSYFGNLGYAYPTALGAKVAEPDKAVVAISGDGGFLFNSQELATAMMYGINVVVIVFNDNAYGNVLRDQKYTYNNRIIGSSLQNPDFVKLAQAYGARGIRAENPDQLEISLREALAIDTSTLIEVPVGIMPSPF